MPSHSKWSSQIEQRVLTLATYLTQQHCLLTTAESCTGGGIAYYLTSIAGSSHWFERGFVTYSNQAKIDLLGVQENSLNQYGAVSDIVASEMAIGALQHSQADLSLAITGYAGPDKDTHTLLPIGSVWLGLARKNHQALTFYQHFTGERTMVRDHAILWAINQLISFINQAK